MTEPISDDVLAELERLEKAATPGPWITGGIFAPCSDRPTQWLWTMPRAGAQSDEVICRDASVTDAALFAAARNALPALLTTARRHAKLLADVEQACKAAVVFSTPQERLRDWNDYKEDAARKLAELKEQTHG